MNTPTTAITEQKSTLQSSSTKQAPSQTDDGSKQLAWILIIVMMLFASLTVVSYQEKSVTGNTPAVKQSESPDWKNPKQVSSPDANSDKVKTQDTELKPEQMGRGELIHA